MNDEIEWMFKEQHMCEFCKESTGTQVIVDSNLYRYQCCEDCCEEYSDRYQ